MIKLTGIILIIALCRAWYLIRTSRMPTQEDVQTPVEDLPDSEKITITTPYRGWRSMPDSAPPVYQEENEK